MRTLKFSIYDEFACTGPECEDSCCKHWKIFLTKREYLDYKKMECSPELKAVIDSAFKREKTGNDFQYARMELKEDGSCPFLGEDRLCMLQKEKGESVLTIVCGAFPRNWRSVGKEVAVFTLTPTCYHVVELLMKHPEGLVLTEGEYDGKNKWIQRGQWEGAPLNPDDKIYPYIWQIKTAQLDILQNREFTIAERLLILGYYTKKAAEYLESSPEKIEQLGAMMLDKELCRKIADSLKPTQTAAEAAAKSADILFKLKDYINKHEPKSHLAALLNAMADSVQLKYEIGDEGKYTAHFSISAYAKNREIYGKIEEERPYIAENLLASVAFRRFSKDEKELWSDYFSLAVLYNFLNRYTAAFLPVSYTDKDLAMAITNIVKAILNSNLAKAVTMRDFVINDANSLPHVAFLIG